MSVSGFRLNCGYFISVIVVLVGMCEVTCFPSGKVSIPEPQIGGAEQGGHAQAQGGCA